MRSSSIFGGGVPLGSFLPFPGAVDNFTQNGSEFLRTGVYKAVAGYSALLTNQPQLGIILGTAKAAPGAPSLATCAYSSGRYYFFGGGAPRSTASLATAPVSTLVDTASVTHEVLTIGTTVVHFTGADAYTFAAGSDAAVAALTTGTQVGATNGSNLSGCFAGMVATAPAAKSTNGTTWASNAITGGAAGATQAMNAVWSAPSSTIVGMAQNGKAWSTADCIAVTDRGAVSGMTAWTNDKVANTAASTYSATDGANMLMVGTATIAGAGIPGFVKTTDGSNFTFTSWASLGLPLPSGTGLLYAGGLFIAYDSAVNTKSSDRTGIYGSSDGGATWFLLPAPIITQHSTAVSRINYLNGEFVYTTASTGSANYTTATINTATHVGVQKQVSTGQAGSITAFYVRIK